MYSIFFERVIKAPVQTVFQCITEQYHLQRWFAPQVIITPVKNTYGAFAFEFELSFKVQITELDENRKISWQVIEGIDGWTDSVISFEMIPNNEETVLIFKHIKISDKTKLPKWEESWKDFLNKLADYVVDL